MTDRDAILRKILEEPANDDHRLAFAAWCQDDGDNPARAEFIRVQVELAQREGERDRCITCARPGEQHHNGPCRSPLKAIMHRARELFGRAWQWIPEPFAKLEWGIERYGMVTRHFVDKDADRVIDLEWRRGFISSTRCSWPDWLRYHAAIYWHPEQMVKCPTCEGRGKDAYVIGAFGPFPNGCPHCSGGRIPRPFVATAQPLELVRLTTWPDPIALNDTRPADAIYTSAGTIVRVKCATCDGTAVIPSPSGARHAYVQCPKCDGGRFPPNRWTCDKWKGLEFAMPEAAAHEVAPPVAGWTWRVDRSGLTTPINHFTVIGLLTVHLEWFHQWDGDAPTLGTQFRVDQPDITTEAFLASVEPELRGRERWLRLTAVGIGVPIFRGESVLR